MQTMCDISQVTQMEANRILLTWWSSLTPSFILNLSILRCQLVGAGLSLNPFWSHICWRIRG